MRFPLTGLYAARPSTLQPGGERSAILKTPLDHAVVTPDGLAGDEQADRRVHGGPDKALHQYAQGNYARIVAQCPELAGIAVPGSIGENLSCPGLSEDTVCIGDRWQLGSAVVEVTQPRSPCVKIDSRYQQPGLASFIFRERLNGWYLRVLSPGEVATGSGFILLERPNPTLSLARFLALVAEHRPAVDVLEAAAMAPGLAADWRRRLQERCAFLRNLA